MAAKWLIGLAMLVVRLRVTRDRREGGNRWRDACWDAPENLSNGTPQSGCDQRGISRLQTECRETA